MRTSIHSVIHWLAMYDGHARPDGGLCGVDHRQRPIVEQTSKVTLYGAAMDGFVYAKTPTEIVPTAKGYQYAQIVPSLLRPGQRSVINYILGETDDRSLLSIVRKTEPYRLAVYMARAGNITALLWRETYDYAEKAQAARYRAIAAVLYLESITHASVGT